MRIGLASKGGSDAIERDKPMIARYARGSTHQSSQTEPSHTSRLSTMNTKRQARRLTTAAALFVLPAVLVGCSSSDGPRHAGDIDSIRWNPSPALRTLSERESDRLNSYARAKDNNLRALSEDVDAIFYLHRPSRLHQGVKR